MPDISFDFDWAQFLETGQQMIDFLATEPYALVVNIGLALGIAGIALAVLFLISTNTSTGNNES